MVGITAYGGYVPRLRLQRKAMAQANAWFNPGLMGQGKGERSMANWDEDSVTMAVEASRDCLNGTGKDDIDSLYFASTTMPFTDRQNSGILAAALTLDEDIQAADISSSQRAGTTALMNALNAVKGGAVQNGLVATGEKRKARSASVQEFQFGDAAAALTVGAGSPIATYLGGASVTVDFVDHFRGDAEEFDYNWEERWIRDEGIIKIVPRAVKSALENAGVSGSDINHFVFPCVFPRLPQNVAKQSGIDPETVTDNLAGNMGQAGAAHALVMLVHALENAEPGQKILVASFGQGCDALIFEVTPEIKKLSARRGISGCLADRTEETNYMKYLAFNGLIELEKGMRAEVDKKTALTTQYRKRDMLYGLVGGICKKCGTAQFPRSRICVNPNCQEVDSQEPYNFADKTAKIQSWSADYLAFSIDPPSHYGMITFEEGGRFLTDFTDVEVGSIDSGMSVRMVFRIKDFDDRRGYVRYFWKAVLAD